MLQKETFKILPYNFKAINKPQTKRIIEGKEKWLGSNTKTLPKTKPIIQ